MTKYDQDISEPIYKDIKAIIDEHKEYMKSEYAKQNGSLEHEMIVAIVQACRKNKYFSVRYY